MKLTPRLLAAVAAVQVCFGIALMSGAMMQPSPQKTGVSIGPGVAATCADIVAGATQTATLAEWCRYVSIQNLSATDLEIECGTTSTSRSTCNAVLKANMTMEISNEVKQIAIKNIGGTTADFNGSDRTVLITGWR